MSVSDLMVAPREHAKYVRGAGDRLVILLAHLDEVFANRGVYGDNKRAMPSRYQYLHPAAAESLLDIETDYPDVCRYSDVLRNATGSKGRRMKNYGRRIARGQSAIFTGKLPGSSGHNVGFSTDHDVRGNMERMAHFVGVRIDKEDYDLEMRKYGWYCHRDGPEGDHKMGREDWHYNFFGDDPERWLSHSHRRTSGGLEAKMLYTYGPFTLSEEGVREHLVRFGYLVGKNASAEALRQGISLFQSCWTLPNDGVAGPQTQRAMLYVGAEIRDGSGNELTGISFP